MEQTFATKPQFGSTIELNHDTTTTSCNQEVNAAAMLKSNAFICQHDTARATNTNTTASKSSEKAPNDISSCDSMNLGPINRAHKLFSTSIDNSDNSHTSASTSNTDRQKQLNKKIHHHHHHQQTRDNKGAYIQCLQDQEQQNHQQDHKLSNSNSESDNMKIRRSKKLKKKQEVKKRPHFRIDWRQLSYYQRPHSFLTKCLQNLDIFSPSNSKTIDQELMQKGKVSKDEQSDRSEVSSLVTGTGTGIDSENSGEPRQILNSLDGYFKSGELSAILGPSGAGKSTFLSTLFGAKQESAYGYTKVTWLNDSTTNTTSTEGGHGSSGLVTTVMTTNKSADIMDDDHKDENGNGKENGDDDYDERHRSLRIAFLPQHDHLLHHLTVYETLMFASKIKNHDRFERQQQEELSKQSTNNNGDQQQQKKATNFHHMNVKRVAKMLKLTECLNTRCGKLSGGQYKRVSIGQELLSEPDVIILDEPTSGLDAMTCLTTVQTLKSIVTKHPMSIILTIHQPDNDVFSLFDKVYVIAQGGMAIYEGTPEGIFPTLAEVDLIPPRANYNPARFIVENAFIPEQGSQDHLIGLELGQIMKSPKVMSKNTSNNLHNNNNNNDGGQDTTMFSSPSTSSSSSPSSSSDDDEDDEDDDDLGMKSKDKNNYFKRSMQSLTDTIMGKETPFVRNSPFTSKRDTISRRPLLNIGIRTLDGQLITSEQLNRQKELQFNQQQEERIQLLKRLNQIQKAKYEQRSLLSTTTIDKSDDFKLATAAHQTQTINNHNNHNHNHNGNSRSSSSGRDSPSLSSPSPNSSSSTSQTPTRQGDHQADPTKLSSSKSDYSSASASSIHINGDPEQRQMIVNNEIDSSAAAAASAKSVSLACLASVPECSPISDSLMTGNSPVTAQQLNYSKHPGQKHQKVDNNNSLEADLLYIDTTSNRKNNKTNNNNNSKTNEFVVDFGPGDHQDDREFSSPLSGKMSRIRKFDKRLSAKHNCSKQTGYPILYHALLLTHRTWLSIVRDPIFFGIQACMHTLIPIVLATIFGSVQEEGCPRIGNFDLVDFAYSDSENLIQGTVRSIRQSIGNIGIVFFEMFVICFAINCITALVFPLDMYVLLKEYRNGWYSLRSYFMGRTLADLPVPVVLHSIGMAILYFMTGQPHSWWRFSSIVLLVILASLVAQSVGLTIGALLMKSSQSAVLAAAGIVAPFFALSGFIVRIHTLPVIAQLAANVSYLYHLLNGFIILRYGFGRCQCSDEDFEHNSSHQIPSNLHTMASMWIGTYSDEYMNSSSVLAATNGHHTNRTNIDPNIDVVDKMMTAFKMANSYGHQIDDCNDVLPYAMLDFNQRDQDIYYCFITLIIMVIVTRMITFLAIYYKIRSFA